MTATGCACQFRAPNERPESTHCCRSPTGYGWTAVDPQRPFAFVDGDDPYSASARPQPKRLSRVETYHRVWSPGDKVIIRRGGPDPYRILNR